MGIGERFPVPPGYAPVRLYRIFIGGGLKNNNIDCHKYLLSGFL